MREGHEVSVHGHWSETVSLYCSCGASADPELDWGWRAGTSVSLGAVQAWAADHGAKPPSES